MIGADYSARHAASGAGASSGSDEPCCSHSFAHR